MPIIKPKSTKRGRKALPYADKKSKGMSIVLSLVTKALLIAEAKKLKRRPAEMVRVIIEEWLESRAMKGENNE